MTEETGGYYQAKMEKKPAREEIRIMEEDLYYPIRLTPNPPAEWIKIARKVFERENSPAVTFSLKGDSVQPVLQLMVLKGFWDKSRMQENIRQARELLDKANRKFREEQLKKQRAEEHRRKESERHAAEIEQVRDRLEDLEI